MQDCAGNQTHTASACPAVREAEHPCCKTIMVQTPFDHQPSGVAVTYQVKHLPCSSPGCILCLTERGHGPYWYAQYDLDGVAKHVFLGRKFKPLDLSKLAPPEAPQPQPATPMKRESSTHALKEKFQPLPTSAEFERDLLLLKGAARGENLKGVYRKLIKKYHPDQFKGHPQMNRWMSEINGQYKELLQNQRPYPA